MGLRHSQHSLRTRNKLGLRHDHFGRGIRVSSGFRFLCEVRRCPRHGTAGRLLIRSAVRRIRRDLIDEDLQRGHQLVQLGLLVLQPDPDPGARRLQVSLDLLQAPQFLEPALPFGCDLDGRGALGLGDDELAVLLTLGQHLGCLLLSGLQPGGGLGLGLRDGLGGTLLSGIGHRLSLGTGLRNRGVSRSLGQHERAHYRLTRLAGVVVTGVAALESTEPLLEFSDALPRLSGSLSDRLHILVDFVVVVAAHALTESDLGR